MKVFFLCIAIILLGINTGKTVRLEKQNQEGERIFELRFATIGFGSNMYRMQPVFNVEGNRFAFTSEQAWVSTGQRKIERDSLLTGNFRESSIDSISNLVGELKDSVIRRSNPRIMSGAAVSIEITTATRKVVFDLHNKSDTTADKIVRILNTYIPNKFRELYISGAK